MRDYSQQGFEASHKDQRQLWLKASSHDCKGEATSIEQMLVHFYAEKILFLRYCLQEALRVIQAGKAGQNIFSFHFRGCGWKKKTANWDEDEQVWVKVMNQLLTLMYGKEFFVYEYNEKKVCMVADDSRPTFKYSAEQWNEEYSNMITEGTTINAEGSYCTLYCYEALLHVTISEGPRAAVGISMLSLLLFLSLTSAFSQELSCCFTRVVLSLIIIHLLHVVVSELCCLSELTLTGLVLNPL